MVPSIKYEYLASVLLAFSVSGAYHVAGDLFGRVTHIFAVLVRDDGHVDFLEDVGRLFPFAQPTPSDHGALRSDVGRVRCVYTRKGSMNIILRRFKHHRFVTNSREGGENLLRMSKIRVVFFSCLSTSYKLFYFGPSTRTSSK